MPIENEIIPYFNNFYGFLKNINLEKTQIIINMNVDNFNAYNIIKPLIIITTFAEAPRYEQIVELANKHTDKQFIFLADVNIYNYILPSNMLFFKYRHWYIFLKFFDFTVVPKVKSKSITKKFSSQSYYKKQARAVVTAALLTYAKEQSIISWRNVTWSPYHNSLIENVKNNILFADLDWKLLDLVYEFDYFTKTQLDIWGFNNCIYDVQTNISHNSCLINFSNETTHFGLHWDEHTQYNRPGPFLTEKTWRPLVAGNILLNSAQPFCYEFLKNDYGLPINYSIDTSYDQVEGDIDRLVKIKDLIAELAAINLSDLIDQNIDNCQLTQDTIMDPEYLHQFELFNKIQDLVISEKISQLYKNL